MSGTPPKRNAGGRDMTQSATTSTPTVCAANMCCGCMACVAACHHNAVGVVDSVSEYNAYIDTNVCVDCAACRRVCPQNENGLLQESSTCYEGWAVSDDVRSTSSSGGLAAAISYAFVKSGGVVCSCAFENGTFGFSFALSTDDLEKFSGSKYVRSNPIGCHQQVREFLRAGQRVLFVGLPCQIVALKNFVGTKLIAGLYTADLICHGTPSPQLLELFLGQHGAHLHDLESLQFRKKGSFRLSDGEVCFAAPGTSDTYSIAFLDALDYAEGCYSCPFARPERVGDLTFGDSWGSQLVAAEIDKGVSLVLCQTEKGVELLEMADVQLLDADADIALETNGQLRHPSAKPKARKRFFKLLQNGSSFDAVVHRCLPKQAFKQDLKGLLIRLGLYKPRGGGILLPERGSGKD